MGEEVPLGDLEPDAAKSLLPGLADCFDPPAVLGRVLHWTDGHPRLTQALCRWVSERGSATPESVDELVERRLTGSEGEGDPTLREVRRQAANSPDARRWLRLYRRILSGRRPSVDARSPEQTRLRLAALVKGGPGERLRVRNRVFERVFDERWVRRSMTRDPLVRVAAASIAALVVVLGVVIGVIAHQREKRIDELRDLVLTTSDLPLAFGSLAEWVELGGAEALEGIEADRLERILGAGYFAEGADGIERVVSAVLAQRFGDVNGAGDAGLLGALLAALDLGASGGPRYAELRASTLAALRAGRPEPSGARDEGAWVTIPAGEFQMGSPEGEESRDSYEGPRHRVQITSFRLGRWEVTNEEYRRFERGHDSGADDNLPVLGVSWFEAYAYAAWLGGRLPTEAEWEYACRAGTTTAYSFGDDSSELDDYAWWWRNSSGVPHPVGGKRPNPWGLYDMHGNAWEFCLDWFGGYPDEAQRNPTGPPVGVARVARGGSFRHDARYFRSAYRFIRLPWVASVYGGFRVALPAEY